MSPGVAEETEDKASVRLHIFGGIVRGEGDMVLSAGGRHPTDDWGWGRDFRDIDDRDWNSPWKAGHYYGEITVDDVDEKDVEFAVEACRLLVATGGRWTKHDLLFKILALQPDGDAVWVFGYHEVARLAGGELRELAVENPAPGEARPIVEDVAALAGSHYAAARQGDVLRLERAGRGVKWTRIHPRGGAAHCIVGAADALGVGRREDVLVARGSLARPTWERRAVRGRGYVSALAYTEGELLVGTSAGELMTSDGGALRKVAECEGLQVSSVVRFRGVLFASAGWLYREVRGGAERVSLPSPHPRAGALRVVGDRLWLLGAHGVFSTVDGESWSALAFR